MIKRDYGARKLGNMGISTKRHSCNNSTTVIICVELFERVIATLGGKGHFSEEHGRVLVNKNLTLTSAPNRARHLMISHPEKTIQSLQ